MFLTINARTAKPSEFEEINGKRMKLLRGIHAVAHFGDAK